MNVTLRQLKVFEAVARHSSFTLAAEELHLTQPAVSMQVRSLEESAGMALFEKLGRKIYLTEAGREMFTYARSIAHLLDEAEEVLDSLRGVKSGALSVSVATTANYFATRILAGFAGRFSDVSFSLDVTNRETLLRQLDNNERDLVIMGEPPGGIDLVAEPFMENPLVMIAPPDHPLAAEREIPMERFADESFVVREKGSGTRGAIERFFQARGMQLVTGMELGSNEAIKQAVAAGLGLGIASIHTLELELETGRLALLDVADFPIRRNWYIVHREGKRLSPVAQAFRRFVLAEAEGYVALPAGVLSA